MKCRDCPYRVWRGGYCRDCWAAAKKRNAARYADRKQRGICVNCGKHPACGGVRCRDCAAKLFGGCVS